MAKRKRQAKAVLKLQVTGGQADPAPPLGPALSQHGVNIGQFMNQFNEKTREQMGVPLPVEVSIYGDGSFDFDVKSPPASYLVKRAADVAKGSGETGREYVGQISEEQLQSIAEEKMEDLNARDIEAAKNIIAGTARSCGIAVGEEAELVEVESPEDTEEETEELETSQG
jgi:large subunit ribosomal protein L11